MAFDRAFLLAELRRVSGGGLASRGGTVGSLATAKHAIERVVIRLRNRIELVIVAAGTATVSPIRPRDHHIDAIVDDVVRVVHEVAADVRNPSAASVLGSSSGNLIGGQLFQHEAVVGQIAIEGIDHVIAVGERPRVALVFEEDVALVVRVTGDVEPVPGPALAVTRRSEQAVDQFS